MRIQAPRSCSHDGSRSVQSCRLLTPSAAVCSAAAASCISCCDADSCSSTSASRRARSASRAALPMYCAAGFSARPIAGPRRHEPSRPMAGRSLGIRHGLHEQHRVEQPRNSLAVDGAASRHVGDERVAQRRPGQAGSGVSTVSSAVGPSREPSARTCASSRPADCRAASRGAASTPGTTSMSRQNGKPCNGSRLGRGSGGAGGAGSRSASTCARRSRSVWVSVVAALRRAAAAAARRSSCFSNGATAARTACEALPAPSGPAPGQRRAGRAVRPPIRGRRGPVVEGCGLTLGVGEAAGRVLLAALSLGCALCGGVAAGSDLLDQVGGLADHGHGGAGRADRLPSGRQLHAQGDRLRQPLDRGREGAVRCADPEQAVAVSDVPAARCAPRSVSS